MATTEAVAAFMAADFPQTKCTLLAVGDGGATFAHATGTCSILAIRSR